MRIWTGVLASVIALTVGCNSDSTPAEGTPGGGGSGASPGAQKCDVYGGSLTATFTNKDSNATTTPLTLQVAGKTKEIEICGFLNLVTNFYFLHLLADNSPTPPALHRRVSAELSSPDHGTLRVGQTYELSKSNTLFYYEADVDKLGGSTNIKQFVAQSGTLKVDALEGRKATLSVKGAQFGPTGLAANVGTGSFSADLTLVLDDLAGL